jgi:hypothetical protein
MATQETRELTSISLKTPKLLREEVKDIKVIPFNMDALNKDIDDSVKENIKKAGDSSFAPKIEPNEFFVVRGYMGVIKGTNILIDRECVGEVSDKPSLDVYSETRDEFGKTKSFGIFPRFTSRTSLDELVKDYGQHEVSLDVFMGDRFAYNGRIVSNIHGIIKELKKVKK